jgi:hypothetical protein
MLGFIEQTKTCETSDYIFGKYTFILSINPDIDLAKWLILKRILNTN